MKDPTDPTEKPCTICKVVQPLDNFHRDSQKKDGRSSWCKPCTKIKSAANPAAKAPKAQSATPGAATPAEALQTAQTPKAKRPRKPLTAEQKIARNAAAKTRRSSGRTP